MPQDYGQDRFAAKPGALVRFGAEQRDASPHPRHDHRLEHLIDRLPERWQARIRWLRRPSLRWVRIPAGTALIAGSFLFILPLFGLWMLPLGLLLLADDVPVLQRLRTRALDWTERRRPHWFMARPAPPADKEEIT